MAMDSASMSRMIYMAYPYYSMWLSGFQSRKMFDFHLPVMKEMPLLYFNEACKNIQFHSKEGWQEQCDCRVGCRPYLQQPDICFDAIKNFFLDAATKKELNHALCF